MKLNKLLLFGLLFFTGILNAQTDFRPGFVIENSGDTLFGQIDYRGDQLMSNICKFKNANNTIIEYYPNDIKAFRFTNSKYYVSREIEGKTKFLEYLIKGKVNIYYLRDVKGDHYYLDKEDVPLTEIPYEQGIRYVDDVQYFYESKKHIGVLGIYMQDAPEVQSRIQAMGKPEHDNLIHLAEDYHNAVCEGEQCIIFEKNLPPVIKIQPEIVGGAIHYSNVENLVEKFYVHAGLVCHVWMPRTSEKLYFRTGVLFSQLDYSSGVKNVYKIPFQFEYIYPSGLFRPRFAYGLNIYFPVYQSVSFNLGGNIKLTENLFLSVTSDVEFNPTLVILPKDLLSYSFMIGLFVNIQ